MAILFSFIGSSLVVLFLYGLYWFSSRRWASKRAYAECWWLSGWNCFRFVIRNMHSKNDIVCVEYRSWLRKRIPPKVGSSVASLIDIELTSGRRVLLPWGQDLPVLCFRFEKSGKELRFVNTDKLGQQLDSFELSHEVDSVNIEYYLKAPHWFLFKHEIARAFEIPHYLTAKGREVDVFEDLENRQAAMEAQIRLVFETAEVITVAV